MSTQDATMDAPTKVSDLGKAVAVIDRGGHALAIPENLNQQIEFAKVMSLAGAMIGKPFRGNPGACLGICNQAWQWGMNPFSVSQKAYLVNDIIAFEAQLVHAVVLKLAPLSKRPRFTYDGEGDARRCTVTFWVKGEDEPLTYTSPAFGKITPKNSPLWKTDPDQQLSYFTIRAGARRHFPEVIMGVLDHEEAIEITRIEGDKTRVITLSGTDTDNIPEAEFSDGTAVLAKNAKKKRATPKGSPEGDGSETSRAESPSPAAEEDASKGDKPAADAKPNEPEADGLADDAALLQQILAAISPDTPMANRKLVKSNLGFLRRLAETSEDEGQADSAQKLLEAWISK